MNLFSQGGETEPSGMAGADEACGEHELDTANQGYSRAATAVCATANQTSGRHGEKPIGPTRGFIASKAARSVYSGSGTAKADRHRRANTAHEEVNRAGERNAQQQSQH